jgi:hypothetical protein
VERDIIDRQLAGGDAAQRVRLGAARRVVLHQANIDIIIKLKNVFNFSVSVSYLSFGIGMRCALSTCDTLSLP